MHADNNREQRYKTADIQERHASQFVWRNKPFGHRVMYHSVHPVTDVMWWEQKENWKNQWLHRSLFKAISCIVKRTADPDLPLAAKIIKLRAYKHLIRAMSVLPNILRYVYVKYQGNNVW